MSVSEIDTIWWTSLWSVVSQHKLASGLQKQLRAVGPYGCGSTDFANNGFVEFCCMEFCCLWYGLVFSSIFVLIGHLTLLVGRQEGHLVCKKWGDGGGGHWLVWLEWRPSGWSVCLPLLIFPCTIKSRSSFLAPAHPEDPGKKGRKTVVVWLWTVSWWWVVWMLLGLCVCVLLSSWTSCSAAARLSRGLSSIWWSLVVRTTATRRTLQRSSVCLKYSRHTTLLSSVSFYSSWLAHRGFLSEVSHHRQSVWTQSFSLSTP